MSMQDPTHFTVKVRVGVGNIRGTAEIKMELAEAMKPQRAQYKGQGTAVGSQVTVSAGFDLRPNGESTKVSGRARPTSSASWRRWPAACWNRWAARTSRS